MHLKIWKKMERIKLLWLVVTFLQLQWESRRLANLRRQSTARDCRLSDENRANKEIDIIWRSSSANVRSEVSKEFNANDPRSLSIAASWKAPCREIRRLSDRYFFFRYHKSDVNCSPGSNSMIEKVLQIALTYLSPLLCELARVFSAHILMWNKRF